MVLASQFGSLLHPFLIMFSVPLGFIGVVWALFLTHNTLSVISFIGIIMMVGVVVSNAIILVDYINRLREEQGVELKEAIVQGRPDPAPTDCDDDPHDHMRTDSDGPGSGRRRRSQCLPGDFRHRRAGRFDIPHPGLCSYAVYDCRELESGEERRRGFEGPGCKGIDGEFKSS